MPVESVTYISDLVPTNPVGATDPKSQGDDHIRNIKLALKNTFPSLNGAASVTPAQLNVLTGTTNDRLVRVTAGALNLGQLTAGMFPSAVVPDVALSSNVPLLAASNVFTASPQSHIGTGNTRFMIGSSSMSGADRLWALGRMSDTTLQIGRTWADNGTGTGVNTALTAQRTGTTITSVELGPVAGGAQVIVTPGLITLAGSGETLATFADDGASTLYHNNVVRFATTTAGFQIVDAAAPRLDWMVGATQRAFASYTESTSVFRIDSDGALDLAAGNTVFQSISAAGNFDFKAGAVTTTNTSASEVGFKGVPRVSKTADYTIAAVDAGTMLVLSSAADDITVQATGAPPPGSVVFVENNTGGSVDIEQGSGMTLTLDGTATSGSRTLAANGTAYVRFTSSSTARVGGPGVA